MKQGIIQKVINQIVELVGVGVINHKDKKGYQATFSFDETYNGLELFQQYGICSSPPKGTRCIAVSKDGKRSQMKILGTKNKQDVDEGDVLIFSDKTLTLKASELKIGKDLALVSALEHIISSLESLNARCEGVASLGIGKAKNAVGDLVAK